MPRLYSSYVLLHYKLRLTMAKRRSKKSRKQKQSANSTMIFAIFTVAVVLVGGVIFLLNSSSDNTVTATIQSQNISPDTYVSTFNQESSDHILIDVRTPEEFASGHIAGAVNIPVQQLEQRLSEVPDDKEIVVYCRSGNRSATASQILANSGYSDVYDMGGIIAWQQAGYPIE